MTRWRAPRRGVSGRTGGDVANLQADFSARVSEQRSWSREQLPDPRPRAHGERSQGRRVSTWSTPIPQAGQRSRGERRADPRLSP